jgi:hypothetical protein
VIRKVREANSQTPRGQRAIVVVDVGGLKNLDRLQESLRFEAVARPEYFECVVSVIVITTSPEPNRFRNEVTVCIPVRDPALSKLEWQVVEALLGRSPNAAPQIAHRADPDGELPFGPGASLLCPLHAIPPAEEP